MGVQGWSWLLKEEGYLPDHSGGGACCTCSLWRAAKALSTNHDFAARLEIIPKASILHIDGNGLAFALHHVAYGRHISRVLGGNARGNAKATPCSLIKKLSNLSADQARQLLPNLVPMTLLSEVTREYLDQLQNKHQMKLKVYWDGTKRHAFKAATDQKRQEKLPEEWSNLRMFCLNGVLPSVSKVCELEYKFPKCRTFQSEIAETLNQQGGIEQIYCDEEADVAMARAASGQLNAYILGLDSDFCFFPDIQYIPFSTLDASNPGSANAVVVRRSGLVRELDLPDEASMTEVAILLGCDYFRPSDATLNGFVTKGLIDVNNVLEFVREKGPGYRVTSPSEDTEEALLFVRTLYALESLDDFELHDKSVNVSNLIDENDEGAAGDLIVDPNENGRIYRPQVPANMPVKLLAMDPRVDRSLKDAVIRCLEAYIEAAELTDSNAPRTLMISEEQLEAFRNMTEPFSEKTKSGSWTLDWEDVPAAYLIEKMLWKALDMKSPLAQMSPSTIFDQATFFQTMSMLRGAVGTPSETEQRDESTEEQVAQDRLPVDEHEERILESISKNRVTIIKGETGCGKSSRIPVMILHHPPPDPSLTKVKMFISQPRRISAKGLVERVRAVEPELGKKFALRLGHGLREYENEETCAIFCTSGYLVRLLANHPERFDDISHLIIDEVHDRGVDLDLLCLLCRRLLQANSRIRLVLMSATLAASLYQDYFGTVEPVIEVGARRFPVEEVFLDEMIVHNNSVLLPQKAQKTAAALKEECDRLKCKFSPSTSYLEKLESLTSQIISSVGRGGTCILVFVPGMNEIIACIDLIEQLFVPGTTFTTIPVHSEIPFETQMTIFSQTNQDECRVVVATNSAESSVTLPALDYVIDLGLCRQIVYNEASHRQMLTSAWISRASATQRAGRTGRIREGKVFRLYSRDCYKHHMEAFEPGEMVRIPLDSVILMLKGILPHEESASAALLDCLEPPNQKTIQQSFKSLHDNHFLSSPNDEGEITNLGEFVSTLGVDLALGSLIGLGIQFGVGSEAIQLAAVLSFPKPPWIISNPLIHGAAEFNEMSSKTYCSRCHFDNNLFSEPLAVLNLLWDYERAKNKQSWCWRYGIALQRIKRLLNTCVNLQRRVADMLQLRPQFLDMKAPPRSMPSGKLAILRIIQVWVFHDTIVEFKPKTKQVDAQETEFTIPLLAKSDNDLTEDHFKQIFDPMRHPFEVKVVKSVQQTGQFQPENGYSYASVLQGDHESRFISYAIETKLSIILYWSKKVVVAYVDTASRLTPLAEAVLARLCDAGTVAGKPVTGTRRGIGERSCGAHILVREGHQDGLHTFRKFVSNNLSAKQVKSFNRDLDSAIKADSSLRSLSLQLIVNERSFSFSLNLNGEGIHAVPAKDLRDLLFAPIQTKPNTQEYVHRRELAFRFVKPGPWLAGESVKSDEASVPWPKPLLECIPEAARLFLSLAFSNRREHVIRLSPLAENNINFEDEAEEQETTNEEYLEVYPDVKKIGNWTRPSGAVVYMPDLSLPRSAAPRDPSVPLQCCAANALEIRGGALKVEGLTLLPPGRLFSFLCRLSFGIDEIDLDDDPLVTLKGLGPDGGSVHAEQVDNILERCCRAQEFNERSRYLGEELICETSFVANLLDIFDGLHEDLKPWNDLEDNPFTLRNLKIGRDKRRSDTPNSNPKEQQRIAKQTSNTNAGAHKSPQNSNNVGLNDEMTQEKNDRNNSKNTRLVSPEPQSIEFPVEMKDLFVTELPDGTEVGVDELPSPNILALLIQKYRHTNPEMKFDGQSAHWKLYKLEIGKAEFFQAVFTAGSLAPNIKRAEDDPVLPDWIRQRKKGSRPVLLTDVVECVPSQFSTSLLNGSFESKQGVFFGTVDTAIRLECAMWLEGQFRNGTTHWYHISLASMVEGLQNEMKGRKEQRHRNKLKHANSST